MNREITAAVRSARAKKGLRLRLKKLRQIGLTASSQAMEKFALESGDKVEDRLTGFQRKASAVTK